jgi:hypothetical protein
MANTPIELRKLRIAWSVFWGIACVLLIGLWVRSYRPTGPIELLGVPVWFDDGAIRVFDPSPPPGVLANDSIYFNDSYFRLPIWWLAGGAIAAVVVPWLRWRFSLRTLLIATTLVALVLGLIVYATT